MSDLHGSPLPETSSGEASNRRLPAPPADEAVQSLQKAIDGHALPERLSEPAVERLFERQTRYLEDLGNEAILVARRAGNHEVQPVDIDQAEEIIRARRRESGRSLEAFGGLLAGIGGSTLATELTASRDPRMWLIAVAVVVFLVGALMLQRGIIERRLA